MYMFGIISHGIDCICALEKNPIEEIYDIKQFIMDHLKDEKSSPQYQKLNKKQKNEYHIKYFQHSKNIAQTAYKKLKL